MTGDLLAAISHSADRLWLTRCRDLNRELRQEAVEARLRDLDLRDALQVKPESQSIEDRVLESLRVYRAALKHKHGKNQAAGYTERDIREYGPREALIRTIRKGKKTSGLSLLVEHDRLDCSYEQIAIDHANELPESTTERRRMHHAHHVRRGEAIDQTAAECPRLSGRTREVLRTIYGCADSLAMKPFS